MRRLWLACKAFWRELCRPKEVKELPTGERAAAGEERDREREDLVHLRLLAALQRVGRLVDFLQEDIEGFDDAQVGAAVREVHRSCRQCLEELVTLRPLLAEGEGDEIRIPKGYDAARIKLVGKVSGEPPYVAHVVHRGWEAKKRRLPPATAAGDVIVAPAEVEVR